MNVVNEVCKIGENAFEKYVYSTVLHISTLVLDIHILEIGSDIFDAQFESVLLFIKIQ
jgi:hypothetical protein